MSGWFRYAFTLVAVCGSIVAVVKVNNEFGFIMVLILAFILILAWTSFYMVGIDTEEKTYSDWTVVMGRKYGSTKAYDEIEDIFIKKFNTTSSVVNYGTGRRYETKDTEFVSYLKFRSGVKLELVTDNELEELISRLKPIAKKLGTEIRQS